MADSDFRLLAEYLPTLCWIANGDGYILWYNRRWHEYCGTTAAEMEGWGWQSVHDPEVLPAVVARWTHSIATGEAFEMTFPLKGADGLFRPFLTRVQPVKDDTGQVVRWFGANTEISAQVAAEAALRESEARFREMADSAPAPVWVTNEHGVEFANAALADFVGLAPNKLRGAIWTNLFHPDDIAPFLERRRIAWEKQERYQIEVRVRRADGEWRWPLPSEMQVLVLEDEPIIGFALEDMLLSIGCAQVRLATNISQAQRILREEQVDAAILDVNIHGTVSYPIADELADQRVPYIFATGYGDRAHPDRHRNIPTVTKPYSARDIQAALAAATHG